MEAELEAIYAEIPHIDCKGLCARACGPIMTTLEEAERVTKRYSVVGMHSGTVALFDVDRKLRCHLLKAGRCTVYEQRPLICRLWGVSEDMPCHMGCVPERWLTAAESRDLLRRLHNVRSTS